MAGNSKQTIGRKDDEDYYISLLPDCIIHHVFSLLPTRDVVKTCVLSKRWRSVWTTVSDLRFSVSSYDDPFVDRVLTLYRWGKVTKFHLYITSDRLYTSKIDSWVRFAIDHQMEELLLNLNWGLHYTLPPLLYNCSSVTKICLSGCFFSSSKSINWSSLKSLYIQNMTMDDDVVRKILMGSPVLEYLNMKNCWGVKGIHSTSLKELVIENVNAVSPLLVSTPRLLSLGVRSHYRYEVIRLVDAPPLLEAELDFDVPPESDFCLLKELLCKLQNASRIVFGLWCLRVMRSLKVEDVQVLLPNCKYLTLHITFRQFSFIATANMLATAPNLEKLVIIFKPYDPCSHIPSLRSYILDHERCWHIKKKFEHWVRHLKNVEIIGFYDCLRYEYGKEVFMLVKFILGHAFVLENMVIKVMNGSQHLEVVDSHKLHEVAKRLQCYDRASKHAIVTLN